MSQTFERVCSQSLRADLTAAFPGVEFILELSQSMGDLRYGDVPAAISEAFEDVAFFDCYWDDGPGEASLEPFLAPFALEFTLPACTGLPPRRIPLVQPVREVSPAVRVAVFLTHLGLDALLPIAAMEARLSEIESPALRDEHMSELQELRWEIQALVARLDAQLDDLAFFAGRSSWRHGDVESFGVDPELLSLTRLAYALRRDPDEYRGLERSVAAVINTLPLARAAVSSRCCTAAV